MPPRFSEAGQAVGSGGGYKVAAREGLSPRSLPPRRRGAGVWATDLTYIPPLGECLHSPAGQWMARGFVYLCAVMDWFARRILASCRRRAFSATRLSNTMEAAFCVETLEDALAKHGKPGIFNTDQGSQFSGTAFTGVLIENDIAISMDGKGAWRDNRERLSLTINVRSCTCRTVLARREIRGSLSPGLRRCA